MEPIELRHRARRAYELGRARLGAKAAGAALLIAAAAVALGRPPELTALLCAALALLAAREEHGAREFLLAGTAVAAVTASFGCTLGGAAGVVGMALGTVAAGAPVWLAARAHR